MKTTRKFATSPDILVTKGKNSVANVTTLVAISSPGLRVRLALFLGQGKCSSWLT